MADVTTVGSMLVNEALPEDMRKEQRVLDKKGVHALFMELAEKHPEKYKDVLQHLSKVGERVGWTEGVSVSLADLYDMQSKKAIIGKARRQVFEIVEDDSLTPEERKEKIVDTLLPVASELQNAVMEEAEKRGSSYAKQIASGARGKKSSLASLAGADLLATDQADQFIPLPLLNSYADGLRASEYFAAGYGQRKGALDVKMATADAGFLNKQLVNATHRQVVSKEKPDATRLPVGLPVDVSDKDNVGAILAYPAGKYEAGTVLTSEILEDLRDEDVDELLVHSPMTEISSDGGISAWAAGRRTRQGLHQVGDNIGIPAAQAIGERLSQGALGSKHSAGVDTKVSRSGFDYINRLIQSPENFPEAGPLAEEDGVVEEVREAAQGGHYIKVGGREYYASGGIAPIVNVGDQVERGDDLTDGVPHPTSLVRLRGMGEARRAYMRYMKEALDNSGVGAHRRNVESVVTGLLNWAQVTSPDGIGDNIYGDVVPYGSLMSAYKPRPTAAEYDPRKAIGKYLEEPVLHYTPGTRINKKVADYLHKWKVDKVYAHDDEPDFEPHMVRGLLSAYHDPDWQTRLSGFYTSRAFQRSVERGLESDKESTSYVPALADPGNFGRRLKSLGKYGFTV